MDKWADFCVSRLNFDEEGNLIYKAIIHEDKGKSVGHGKVQDRDWMVAQIRAGKSFCSVKFDDNYKLQKLTDFEYKDGLFKWQTKLPNLLPRRQVFISFHHGDEKDPSRGEVWKKDFETTFDRHFDAIISKSVGDMDIDENEETEKIRQIIRDDFIADATVTVVLIGPETWKRKHVDWEISSSIKNTKKNKRCGLIGILLPSYKDYDENGIYYPYTIPPRLHYNVESGFAKIYKWTKNVDVIRLWIEEAFNRRFEGTIDDSYPRFGKNRSQEKKEWEPNK